jgi:hypothetical protein
MRKSILTIALVASIPVLGATTAGCSQVLAWWQNFEQNPQAQVSSFEQGVQVAMNDAAIAWVFIQPYIPPQSLASVTAAYTNAIFTVNHAVQLLNDGVTAAINAQSANPNFGTLMAAVTDAVGQVLAILAQWQTPAAAGDAGAAVAGKAPIHPAFLEAQASLASLKKNYHLAH